MLPDHTAQGVFAIAVTPFTPEGAVDYASVDSMTDFYLRSGVTGLTILGIMGEAPKLDPAEALAISNQVVRRSKIPIIVGVSAPGLRGHAVPRSRRHGGRCRRRHDRPAAKPSHRRSGRQLLRTGRRRHRS